MDQDNNTLETRTIWTTIIANLLFSILAFGFAFQTHSDAIVLDGVFSLVAFAVSLLSLFVARLVTRPGTRAFPFGYAIFEPMLNLTKGLMLATVLVYAIFSAIDNLLTGGVDIVLGSAIVYACLATAGCAIVALITHRAARRTKSPILEVDAKNWLVDTLLSAAVMLTFAAALLFKRIGLGWAVPYVDPTLVIALSATVGVLPVWIIVDNLRQIAHMAPEPALQDQVQSIISKSLKGQSLKNRDVRIAKLGRLVYLQLYLMADADRPAELTLSEQDRLRQDLYDLLSKEFGNLALDVIFTTDPVWSARSITSATPGHHGLAR